MLNRMSPSQPLLNLTNLQQSEENLHQVRGIHKSPGLIKRTNQELEQTAASPTLIKHGIPLTNGKAAVIITIGNLIGTSFEITAPVKDDSKTLPMRKKKGGTPIPVVS